MHRSLALGLVLALSIGTAAAAQDADFGGSRMRDDERNYFGGARGYGGHQDFGPRSGPGRFDASRGSARTWLCQIALNQCKNRFRQRDRRRAHSAPQVRARALPPDPCTGSRHSRRR